MLANILQCLREQGQRKILERNGAKIRRAGSGKGVGQLAVAEKGSLKKSTFHFVLQSCVFELDSTALLMQTNAHQPNSQVAALHSIWRLRRLRVAGEDPGDEEGIYPPNSGESRSETT